MARMYTKEHEWIDVEGNLAIIGISNYAQEQLGDVIYVELPELASKFKQGDDMAVVESSKSASEIYAPLSGKVIEVNQLLEEQPELVNEAAESDAWLVKMAIEEERQLEQLLSQEAYEKLLGELA